MRSDEGRGAENGKRGSFAAGHKRRLWVLLSGLLTCTPAFAQAQAQAKLNSGDTAWMLAASMLVFLMTIPGLALF